MKRDNNYLKGNQFAKGNPPNKNTFRKGRISWMKGKKGLQPWHNISGLNKKGGIPWSKGKTGIFSKEVLEKNRQAHLGKPSGMKGKHQSKEAKIKIGLFHKGKKRTIESRKKQGESIKGEKSYLWKGGITPLNHKIRTSSEYKLWNKSNLERDNFTCQKCGQYGGELKVHHINNFADFPELRLALDNGIVFCKTCHNNFHKIYGKQNNTKEQLQEFLTNNI
jgi:hypothetical protein